MSMQQSPWLRLAAANQPLMQNIQYNWKSPNLRYPEVSAMQPEFPPMGLDGIPSDGAMAQAEANAQAMPDVAAMMGLAPEAAAPPPAQAGGSGIMGRDQYAELMDRINASGLESIRMQKEGVGKLEKGLSDYQKLPTQLDLTPLAALVDQWSGSNLVKSYKAPESPQERMAAIQQMEQAVQKARQGVSQSDLELLQRQLQNRTAIEDRDAKRRDEALRRAELEQQRLERQGVRAAEKKIEWGTAWQKDVGNRMTGIANFASALKQARNIIDANKGPPPLGSDDFKLYQSAISQAITNYNRDVAQLGALAGADLGLLEGATGAQINSIADRILQGVKGGYRGTLKSMDELLKAADKAVKNIETTTNKTYGGLLDDLYVDKKIQYENMLKEKDLPGQTVPASGGARKPTRSAAEIRAELERTRAGGQ